MREVKNYETESQGHNFVTGIFLGAAVGAAVALLLAPKTGVDMRHQISETTGRLRRKASEGYGVAAEKVSHIVDDVVSRGKDALHNGQDTYSQVMHAADDAAQSAAKSINKAAART